DTEIPERPMSLGEEPVSLCASHCLGRPAQIPMQAILQHVVLGESPYDRAKFLVVSLKRNHPTAQLGVSRAPQFLGKGVGPAEPVKELLCREKLADRFMREGENALLDAQEARAERFVHGIGMEIKIES